LAARRPTRGLNNRVREAVGARGPAQWDNSELIELMESGDVSPETMERMAQLLGQFGPRWPPNDER
jgi:hypothetical protein